MFEACEPVHVKGKAQAIETFKVLGTLVDGKPTFLGWRTPESTPPV